VRQAITLHLKRPGERRDVACPAEGIATWLMRGMRDAESGLFDILPSEPRSRLAYYQGKALRRAGWTLNGPQRVH
jgi:hypothetical protein